MSTKSKRIIGGVAVSIAALALIAAWLLGLLTPEPERVSLAETVAATVEESVEEPVETRDASENSAVEQGDHADQAATEVATPNPEPSQQPLDRAETPSSDVGPLAGDWQLVPGDGTFAGYRANGTTGEAVGRTRVLVGTLRAEQGSVTEVDITVDMTQLESDSGLRDDHLGDEGISWRTYPEASFSLSAPIPLPVEIAADQELAFDATGTLTVREVAHQVTVALDAVLVDDQLIVVGSTAISLDDFGAGIGGVSDDATMEFSLVFAR